MNAAVLPRVRAKHRKIKPPSPAFWRALLWVVWNVAWLTGSVVLCVVRLRQGSFGLALWDAVMVALWTFLLTAFAWPQFRRELVQWKADQ